MSSARKRSVIERLKAELNTERQLRMLAEHKLSVMNILVSSIRDAAIKDDVDLPAFLRKHEAVKKGQR